MICLNRNLRRKMRIHSVLIGKLLIEKLRQKSLDQVETIVHHIRITEVQLPIVVVIGREMNRRKYYFHFIFISSTSKPTNQSSTSYSGANDGDAQKRFSNAKAISSDQFFNKDSDVRM
jgi:hypothetical protein